MDEPQARFDVEPSVSNHFAWLRTQMSLQRTLMAAVRTSVSLTGFGFTVAQFFDKMAGTLTRGGRALNPEMPRRLGLVLIGAGVISLVIFTWQFYLANRYMRGGPFAPLAGVGWKRPMRSAPYVTAFAVILIGVAAFIVVYARM